MKVLLIYAHPEPRSLNGALKNFAIRHLQQAGHEVQVSDLYAMLPSSFTRVLSSALVFST